MKKKLKYILLVMIIMFVVGGVLFFLLRKNEVISYQKELKLNIGETVPTEIEYKIGNKTYHETIAWNELNLENGNVYFSGQYKGMFMVKKKLYEVVLIVVDEVAPTIEGVRNITIYENEELDLLKDIKVTDNSREEIEIEVKGEYDISKKGIYSLAYEATDKSGNVSREEFTLEVKAEKPTTTNKPNTSTNVIGTTSKGYQIEQRNGIYYIGNILIANKTYALPNTYNPGLLPELSSAFEKLKAGAATDGIELKIISGFRSYSSQNSIYNNYVNRDGKAEADRYSARAGHSEHQTGLAVDLNSLLFSFGETKEGQWIQNNAYKYGFIIRYPKDKENITGYRYEPWHLRYIGDLAEELYNDGDWITLEEYLGITLLFTAQE